MEFAKDIYFDNNLTAGKSAKITYSGYLFQNGANNVNLVYGFGPGWEDTDSTPMEKTDNGFVANIQMKNFDTFNFCFSDDKNNWDNNYNSNFTSPILPEEKEFESDEVTTEQTTPDTDIDTNTIEDNNDNNEEAGYSSSIDNIIEDILENTAKQDIISDKDTTSIDKILETITEETMPEIEALFNDLFFESVKEDEKTNSAVQEISMEPELAEELAEFGKDLESNSLEPVVAATQENDLFDNYDNSELIRQFNELFEEVKNPVNFEIIDETNVQEETTVQEQETVQQPAPVEQKLDVASFNLDNLVSNILEPVISTDAPTEKVEETSLFEDVKAHEEDRENSIAVINSGEFVVGSRKLSYFYKLKKRIRLAFMKLSKLKDELLEQLGL